CPLWLSPEQIRFVPVADRHVEHCRTLAGRAREAGLRPSVDDAKESVGTQIRPAPLMKVPDTVVAGDRALGSGTVTIRDPYAPGHLVVLPARHVADLEGLTEDEQSAIARLVRTSVRVLRDVSEPHGFNIGLNLGRAAGAGIPEHLHWHVVPRWGGDTNFMPVIGQTRVMPELLDETFAKLRPRFEEG